MARHVTNFRGELYFTPNGNLRIKDEPTTPIEEDFGDHNNLNSSFEDYGPIRKSMSMSDITALREDLLKLEFCERDVRDRYRKPSGAPRELSRTKFVSMAEAIYHYQRDTPRRFHSKYPEYFKSHGANGPSGLTVPHSPMLRSKARSRPVHILSQMEKEEIEIEEIKKYKIKAHPIPKSVIAGSNLPDVTKKPVTIPDPFKLTETHKKVVQTPGVVQKFKARPAPKHILEKPDIPIKVPVIIPKPKNSVDTLKHDNKLTEKNQKPEDKPNRMGPVKPVPFSFEKRDEEFKRRREERIKCQIEEERKQACSFKAHPVPGAVKKQMQSAVHKETSSTASLENKENIKFEARPPVVLYKEPFKPVLKPVQLVKPVPFVLNSEKRAVERELFDKQLKEKEEEQERLRQQREKEQLEVEERARAKLRATLVHHARPVPVAAPFHVEKSIATLTVPETPKFSRRQKQN